MRRPLGTVPLLAPAALAALLVWPTPPCVAEPPLSLSFTEPEVVTILGYQDHAMEPDISADGNVLFWNNSNAEPSRTDLHWATRVDDLTFQYRGPVADANRPGVLDATPSMSSTGTLYFVSLRAPRAGTLWWGQLVRGPGRLGIVSPVPITRPPWQVVQLDPEPVPATGTPLYFAWHKARQLWQRVPEMGIGVADWTCSGYAVRADPSRTLPNVNTDRFREYAPAVSADHLELYFTRWAGPGAEPQIWVATRRTTAEPFGEPVHISGFTGIVEAATLTEDGRLYFHKRLDGQHVIMLSYRDRRP